MVGHVCWDSYPKVDAAVNNACMGWTHLSVPRSQCTPHVLLPRRHCCMSACCRPQAPLEGGSELRGQQSWLDPQLQQQADELERGKAFAQHLQASAPPEQQPAPRPQRGELGWSPDPAQRSGGPESPGRAQDQQGPSDQGSEGGSWWSNLVGWLPWGQGDPPQTQTGEQPDGMQARAACFSLLKGLVLLGAAA